jgi:hypothetical protein
MEKLEALGFKSIDEEDMGIFKQYFLKLDKHYSSSLSFNSMLAWKRATPIYYKVVKEYIVCITDDTPTHRRIW